ncbi:hypothetical protein [Paraurantiacibacter namhicola]|uniref:DUF883 domain-containing protein n=1 Tax=Paraurantiacibacter namhicola TaxID=645517 RepID=A0A1C7D9D7_9SPHN|nr:hypothetical protein [Paraurantiacibacter namhicola]ANU07931.1 hypothetical protein A6F65_01632 [Paraurantiacibacter namhicola]
MAQAPAKPTKAKKTTKKASTKAMEAEVSAATASSNTSEAKSRFNAALEEAKAGAAALGKEAKTRAGEYRTQAKSKSGQATTDAKVKARDLANEGKGKASEALGALGRTVGDTATDIDEKLGAKYGDYARSASRSLQEAGAKLDTKSVDEIVEDSREFVRKSPGTAVGIAAVVGFFFARLFRR